MFHAVYCHMFCALDIAASHIVYCVLPFVCPMGIAVLCACMVQLISKLTLTCAEHACVLQFLPCRTCLKCVRHAMGHTCAIFHALHASDICVLHVSHSSRVLHASHCRVDSLIYRV